MDISRLGWWQSIQSFLQQNGNSEVYTKLDQWRLEIPQLEN